MKRVFYTALILSAMLLSVGPTYAGSFVTIQHNFHEMSGGMAFSNSNKTATIAPDTIYTCSGSASCKFNYSTATFSQICAFMESNGDILSMTPAIEYLDSVWVEYFPSNQDYYSSITVEISSDGEAPWTSLSSYATHGKGVYRAKLPEKGTYFVRLRNTSGSDIYIRQIHYTAKPETCSNCFRYVPE